MHIPNVFLFLSIKNIQKKKIFLLLLILEVYRDYMIYRCLNLLRMSAANQSLRSMGKLYWDLLETKSKRSEVGNYNHGKGDS